MRLDADRLRAEVEAHRARMESPLWAPTDGEQDASWAAPLKAGSAVSTLSPESPLAEERLVRPQPSVHVPLEFGAQDILPRLEALDRTVEKLTAMINRRAAGSEGLPDWLKEAAGNPHTYDAPDADRTGVCVRILPTTYAQLQQAQRRMGLRTTAGAWEFLLRLGLAAAERLPAR